MHEPEGPFSILLNKYTEVRLLDHMVVLFCFLILRTSVLHFTIHQKCTGVLTSPHPCQHLLFFVCLVCGFLSSVIFLCFGNGHPNKCKVILLWLWFASPWLVSDVGYLLYTCCPFIYLVWRSIYWSMLPIFKLDY